MKKDPVKEYLSKIGKSGGDALKNQVDEGYYSRNGKKGMQKRWRNVNLCEHLKDISEPGMPEVEHVITCETDKKKWVWYANSGKWVEYEE